MQEDGYRGVRINPGLYPSEAGLDGPIPDRILERCAEIDVAAGFLVGPEHFDAVEALAQRHPSVRMVIDHFGHCRTADGGPLLNPDMKRLVAMARRPNIYVKITEWPRASSTEWPHRDLHPWVHALLDAYGPQRLMWGTDFPYIVAQCGYARGLTMLTEETSGIEPEAMEWLVSKTAENVFGPWG